MDDIGIFAIIMLAVIAIVLISFGWDEYQHSRRVKRIATRGIRRF